MSYLRYLARRAAFAVVSVYLVVSVTFVFGTWMLRDRLREQFALASYRGSSVEDLEALGAVLYPSSHLEQPLHERYVTWLVDVTTLDWGQSIEFGRRPVLSVLQGRVQLTLEYLLPGVLIAMLLGVLLGLFAALAKDTSLDWGVRTVAYAGLGVPVFMLLTYVVHFNGAVVPLVDGWELVLAELNPKTMAAIGVGGSLFAGQLRFSRAAALEQTGQEFVKMLRAKGIRRLGLARHVLRNAAIPILSLSISELLAVLVLNIYVIESVLGLSGLADATLVAAKNGDISLLMWSTLCVVFLGITLNFLQDAVSGYLDPRIHGE